MMEFLLRYDVATLELASAVAFWIAMGCFVLFLFLEYRERKEHNKKMRRLERQRNRDRRETCRVVREAAWEEIKAAVMK